MMAERERRFLARREVMSLVVQSRRSLEDDYSWLVTDQSPFGQAVSCWGGAVVSFMNSRFAG